MNTQQSVNTTPIEQLVERIGVEKVFGEEGDTTIIPVAQVAFGFGYGSGYGRDSRATDGAKAQSGQTNGAGEGGGSGAGAGGRATPCGFIQIGPDGVTYKPIMDETRIPLAGIVMAAWSVFWITATVRTIAKAIARRRARSK
jgi:uncharacterized spore protein YtfJ